MAAPIAVSGVHHIELTVSNPERSRQFYSDVLGFQVLLQLGQRIIMANEALVLVLNPPSNGTATNGGGVGLDHISFRVADLAALEAAQRMLKERGIACGDIQDMSPQGLNILVLPFRDPDNIQIELSAMQTSSAMQYGEAVPDDLR